jgi:hypothetical protein
VTYGFANRYSVPLSYRDILRMQELNLAVLHGYEPQVIPIYPQCCYFSDSAIHWCSPRYVCIRSMSALFRNVTITLGLSVKYTFIRFSWNSPSTSVCSISRKLKLVKPSFVIKNILLRRVFNSCVNRFDSLSIVRTRDGPFSVQISIVNRQTR